MNVSFLLGAGFSVPMGYPIGNSMEHKISELLFKLIQEFNAHPTPYGKYPLILQEIIKNYTDKHIGFNYEEVYEYIDFCCSDERIGCKLNDIWQGKRPIKEYAYEFKNEYQRYICSLIKDENGKQFYIAQDVEHLSKYEKFIALLKDLLDRDYEINIHTLNHDLLFESFRNSGLIGNEICDGFDYENSPYRAKNGENEFLLPYYNEVYGKRIRLYKLHGSIDQYKYYKGGVHMIYDNHIKMSDTVDRDEKLCKLENGKITDVFYFRDLHPDFLTGTYSKIEEYVKNPLCRKLLPLFEENLKKADSLIIIGYGAKDDGINEQIRTNFDHNKKTCFIFDPFPSECLKNFAADIGAQPIIEKSVVDFELPNSFFSL